jgi:hypothetical protein
MANSRFKHPMHAVKALAAAIALMMIAGTAHAADASAVCGPAFDLDAGSNKIDCWVRVMAEKVKHGERLTGAECLIIKGMHGYVLQCEDDEVRPVIQNQAFKHIDPRLYGGLPDSADPDELRKHRERGAAEDAAQPRPRRVAEIPLCVGNCR